jgi:hypothetical protein
VKQHVTKYQEKLFKIDQGLDKMMSDKQEMMKEYYDSRDEYFQSIGKKKAIQSTLLHLIETYDLSLIEMARLRTLLDQESQTIILFDG